MSWFLPDEAATRAAGERLGRLLAEGDVIAAVGDLGAGKTCFAQGVARGLDVPPGHYVNSPTFAILQSHPGRLTLHHIDLYRISDADELLGLGLEELLGVEGVGYVEWPGRAPEVLPADVLWLALTHEGAGRRLRLQPRGPRAEAVCAAFAAGSVQD
ncbi:MAG: tRNA (adenosine(37)-N6)-threonylcarbamoyltransferase complex ATPase subunit type 1 TsaE [Myxococcales bacterium]|nr:tRNA (adenosine(37)-N6)-threonylcarbamoyltransferase complex ATPase subunit type 1 TsaE [Myxococcales bacterium]